MPETKQSFEEERALLLANEESPQVTHNNSHPAFETAIAKGVSSHVGKWPSHLFAAFLAASLIFAAFILFALVMALFCIPTASYRCRRARNVDFEEFPNVYFVKHANRTWSRADMCYVESSALDNPEINVYLINLLTDLPEKTAFSVMTHGNNEKIANKKRDMIEMLVLWEQTNNSIDTIDLSSNVTEEARIRKKLGARYANVRNVDVRIDDFFKGSMLARVCHELDTKTLEIAAKANILWNTPGIALDPSDFRHVRDSKRYLCKQSCRAMKNAAINPEGSFQATGVPCQAFIGYLIREIATIGVSADREIVKRARDNFCQSPRECPGLEIYNDPPRLSQSPYCPTINPSGILSTKVKTIATQSNRFWWV